VLDAIDHDAEGGVDQAAVGIVRHSTGEEELAVAREPVEEVTVVVVRVGAGRVRHRVGGLVDREVVIGSEHDVELNQTWVPKSTGPIRRRNAGGTLTEVEAESSLPARTVRREEGPKAPEFREGMA
jgi:hypothetical protein